MLDRAGVKSGKMVSLEQLPQDPLNNIIDSLGDWQAIKSMRLVFKGWLAAVRLYPGSLRIRRPQLLKDVQHLMPNVQSLAASGIECSFLDLRVLKKCTDLKSMELAAYAPYEAHDSHPSHSCQFAYLPGSLEQLKTEWIDLHASNFVDAGHLTSLQFKGGNSWSCWPALQNLQVSHLQSLLAILRDRLHTAMGLDLYIYIGFGMN